MKVARVAMLALVLAPLGFGAPAPSPIRTFKSTAPGTRIGRSCRTLPP